MTTPEHDRTPGAPDVDQPEGGDHDAAGDTAGRTPDAPDVDQPDGGAGSS